jgi:hypothetical protein
MKPIQATPALLAVFEFLGYLAAQVPSDHISWGAYIRCGGPTPHIADAVRGL